MLTTEKMGASTENPTHYDVEILDDSLGTSEDNEPGIIFPPEFRGTEAEDPRAFAEVMKQPKYRTMLKAAYAGEKRRFVGYNGVPLSIKVDTLVEIPEGPYLILKSANAINLDVARNLARRQYALEHPETAPYAPGQRPAGE